jgi:hypothetical protein
MPHSPAMHPGGAPGRRRYSYLSIGAIVVVVAAVLPFVSVRAGALGAVLGAVGVLALLSVIAAPNPARDGRLAEQWENERSRALRRDLERH